MGSSLIGALRVTLGIDTAAFEQGLTLAQKQLSQAAKKLDSIGGSMRDVGKTLSTYVTLPIVGAGVAMLKTAGDFQKSMNSLQIDSQATSAELAKMNQLALDIGKSTIFGANESAQAMDMLAKNGLSVKDILDGAAKAAANLAAATGSELEPAANAVTNVMAQFGVQAANLPHIVDLITGSVNQSKMSFDDFQLALAQGGAVASAAGVSFEDFNAAIAGIAPMFSSGSDAGTSFKAFINALTPNTKKAAAAMDELGLKFFDASGKMKPLSEIAEQLREKLSGLSDEARSKVLQNIFGTDGVRTAIGLMKLGGQGLDELKGKIAATDAAAQSAQRMKGFNGQLEQLKGALETLAITIAQSGILDFFTSIVTGLTNFVDHLSQASPTALRFGVIIAGLVATIGPLLAMFGMIAQGAASVMAVLGSGALAGVFAAIGPFILPVVAAVAALAAAWALFGDKIGPVLSAFWEKAQAVLGPKLTAMFQAIKEPLMQLWNGPFGQAIRVVIGVLGDFMAAYGKVLGETLIRILSVLVDTVTTTFKVISDIFTVFGALLRGDWTAAWNGVKKLVGDVVQGWLNVLDDLVPGARAAIVKLASGFAAWFGDIGARMIVFGRSIVDGLVRGILAAPDAVWNALKSVVLAGIKNIREFLGIHSPSLLFMEMGGYITDGLADGIKGGLGTVSAAMDQLDAVVAGGTDATPKDNTAGGVGNAGGGGAESPDQSAQNDLRETFRRTFGDGVRAALSGDLGDFFRNWFESIGSRAMESLLNQASDALFNLFSGLFGGKGGGGLGGLLSSIFGSIFGHRAAGGPVLAGMPYIVGEKRPEIFVPSAAGRIVPNLNELSGLRAPRQRSAASGDVHVSMPITLNAQGAGPREVDMLRGQIAELQRKMPGIAVQAVSDASNRRVGRAR